eukprot:scaffold1384_cov116-Cylindrotheca_fusiformis.AAC.49
MPKMRAFCLLVLISILRQHEFSRAFSNQFQGRSFANRPSLRLDATSKVAPGSVSTKVLYQKVIRPSGNLPDILFLGYLVEYLESHFKIPNDLPMIYESSLGREDSHCVVSFDSPLSPSSDATRLEVEVVGIYTDDKSKEKGEKGKTSVPNMAMVVVKKQKSGSAIPPMMENLFADSEKRIVKALDRGLGDFVQGKIKFDSNDDKNSERKLPNVKTAHEAITAEIVDKVPTRNQSKHAANDDVLEAYATSEVGEATKRKGREESKKAALDSMKVDAASNQQNNRKDSESLEEDFAVKAAKKVAEKKKAAPKTKGAKKKSPEPQEDFAVAAARKAVASRPTSRKPGVSKKVKGELKKPRQPSVEPIPSMVDPSFKIPDYMGGARSFRTTISRPADRAKKHKTQKSTNGRKSEPAKKSSKVRFKESEKKRKTGEHLNATQNEVAPAGRSQKSENSNTKRKSIPSKAQIERDVLNAAKEVMEEVADSSEDMTVEEMLQDVLKFDETETRENEPGSGFVSAAFEKAKEVLQERNRQRQERTQVFTSTQPDIADPNQFPVEASEGSVVSDELKRMFEAGEKLADGRITTSLKDDVELGFGEGSREEDIDALIEGDKTISSYARILDDELAELELTINPTPGEEMDGPTQNPVFDIMSGPEVYNPNAEMDTVNYPGALPGTKELRLPKKLAEAKEQAQFAASVLEKMKTVSTIDDNGVEKLQYFTGEKEMTLEQVTNLQKVVAEATEIGIIPDPVTLMAERSRLQLLLDEMWHQPKERFQEIASSYKDLLLSDNFVMLIKDRMTKMADRDLEALRQDDDSLRESHAREREILGALVVYAQLLLKEARALGAELESQQLEVVRSICKVAMDPSHTTEEETAMALADAVRDMRPLLDDMFVAYLKYAVAEEEARLARAGLLDDPDHNQWFFVLQIVQQGVHAEIAKGINRYIDHIGYVLRMKTPRQRRMLLEKLIDKMPTMDVRPFVQVVDNIVGSLGDGTRGEFAGIGTLGELTNELLQLHRDVKELLPPERIALKARDADEWADKQRKRLMEFRNVAKQRLQASKDTAHLEEEIEALGSRGEVERID